MTHPHDHDQLRWQLTEDLAVCLDVAENIVIEAGTERVAVPHATMLIEGLRQARSAQFGHERPDLASFALRTALLKFAQDIAGVVLPDEIGEDPGCYAECGTCGQDEEAGDTLGRFVQEARALLGIGPVPEALDALPPDEAPEFWWNTHNNERGIWCRFSHVAVSAKLAASDDKLCPHECPDSTIEPRTTSPAALAAHTDSPNGTGPSHDTAAE
jgi:hypothetical protein